MIHLQNAETKFNLIFYLYKAYRVRYVDTTTLHLTSKIYEKDGKKEVKSSDFLPRY